MTNYYVSAAGSDSANGLSEATAWRNLSKVAGLSFESGDVISLRRGDRWKEALAVPRGNITINAYGADPVLDEDGYCTNAPIIDGGAFVTGWSTYDGSLTDSYLTDNFTGTSGANLVGGSAIEVGGGTWGAVSGFATPIQLSSDGMARRGTTTGGGYMAAHSQTPASPDYYVEAPIKIKSFLSVDLAYLILRGNPSSQGWTNFTYIALVTSSGVQSLRVGVFSNNSNLFEDFPLEGLEVGDQPVLRAEVEDAEIRGYVDGELVGSYDFDGTVPGNFRDAAGQIAIRMGSGSTPAGSDTTGFQYVSIDAGPLGEEDATDVFQATLNTDPLLVDMDGLYAPVGASQNLLQDGEHYWKSNKLYVCRAAGAPGSTDVVAGTRDNALTLSSISNVTIEDIAVEHTRDNAIKATGASSGATLRRVMAQRTSGGAGNNGVLKFSAHTDITIDGCVLRDCGSDGVYMQSGCTGHTIKNCRLGPFYGPSADCVQDDSTGTVGGTYSANTFIGSASSPKGLLILLGDSYVIEDNYFEGSTNFHIATFGDHVKVRRNVFYNLQSAIVGPGGAFQITGTRTSEVTDYEVHHNVFIDCNPAINVGDGSGGRSALLFYANTIVNVDVEPDQWQVKLQQPAAGEFKNNLIWDATGAAKALLLESVMGGKTWISDYNLIGPEAASYISYGGTSYSTLAAYVSGKSQDAHSINTDPLFVNEGGHAKSDYLLQSDSPALGAGVLIADFVTKAIIGALGAEERGVLIGDAVVASMRLGDIPVASIYLGDTLVWSGE